MCAASGHFQKRHGDNCETNLAAIDGLSMSFDGFSKCQRRLDMQSAAGQETDIEVCRRVAWRWQPVSEGATDPGTIIFPKDASRRLEILWDSRVDRRCPIRLRRRGHRALDCLGDAPGSAQDPPRHHFGQSRGEQLPAIQAQGLRLGQWRRRCRLERRGAGRSSGLRDRDPLRCRSNDQDRPRQGRFGRALGRIIGRCYTRGRADRFGHHVGLARLIQHLAGGYRVASECALLGPFPAHRTSEK